MSEANYRIGELEAELKEQKQSHSYLQDYNDRLDDHPTEIREGMKLEYHCENREMRIGLEREKHFDRSVSIGDIKLAM